MEKVTWLDIVYSTIRYNHKKVDTLVSLHLSANDSGALKWAVKEVETISFYIEGAIALYRSEYTEEGFNVDGYVKTLDGKVYNLSETKVIITTVPVRLWIKSNFSYVEESLNNRGVLLHITETDLV